MPQPGFEPGFLRPQRTVLTTRLLRQLVSFEAKLFGFVSLEKLCSHTLFILFGGS